MNHHHSGDQETSTHSLAAIMFTDIQGYTALMQQDEEMAVRYRARHREVFNASTQKYNGKILQYYGDGTLSTFSSALDAVRCGIEMQVAFQKGLAIPVRIGIHIGDIIFTEDDIIGDGVNITSRIESLAVVGSVFISERVYDEIKNKPSIKTRTMGMFELKNIEKPMEVFALANEGLVVPDPRSLEGKAKRITKDHKPSHKVLSGIQWFWLLLAVVGLTLTLYLSGVFHSLRTEPTESGQEPPEKSIAVLPFINDSHDSSNIYIINGLMEAILNKLQNIENLRVISRTTVERYRNNPKSMAEISEELGVYYIVEGSGQKIGDQLLLSIQLIESFKDKHLWAEQYQREVKDIFKLQSEVATKIAEQIEVYITPEEKERINKTPTGNLKAYDHYLKGMEELNKQTTEGLVSAIAELEKAIHEDSEFAMAYAALAIAYYYMDIFQVEKKYTDKLNYYSDKALVYDPTLPEALISKAYYYTQSGQYDLVLPYLERAHQSNPNSPRIINELSNFYTFHRPNTEKYLEYALKGLRVSVPSADSNLTSFTYLHLSNALIQAGFKYEALKYINVSLTYNPQNLYSQYVKAYIEYTINDNLEQTRDALITTLQNDTTRLDILQETGKICYYLGDYDSAYYFYSQVVDKREEDKLQLLAHENAKMAFVYKKNGDKEMAQKLITDYKAFADADQTIYKNLNLCIYYAYKGDTEMALDYFRRFSQEEDYQYWTILFLNKDPILAKLKSIPEYKRLFHDIERKFWERQKRMEAYLEEEELL